LDDDGDRRLSYTSPTLDARGAKRYHSGSRGEQAVTIRGSSVITAFCATDAKDL
jgi:hypothetical protein